jgi:hypothetical protein
MATETETEYDQHVAMATWPVVAPPTRSSRSSRQRKTDANLRRWGGGKALDVHAHFNEEEPREMDETDQEQQEVVLASSKSSGSITKKRSDKSMKRWFGSGMWQRGGEEMEQERQDAEMFPQVEPPPPTSTIKHKLNTAAAAIRKSISRKAAARKLQRLYGDSKNKRHLASEEHALPFPCVFPPKGEFDVNQSLHSELLAVGEPELIRNYAIRVHDDGECTDGNRTSSTLSSRSASFASVSLSSQRSQSLQSLELAPGDSISFLSTPQSSPDSLPVSLSPHGSQSLQSLGLLHTVKPMLLPTSLPSQESRSRYLGYATAKAHDLHHEAHLHKARRQQMMAEDQMDEEDWLCEVSVHRVAQAKTRKPGERGRFFRALHCPVPSYMKTVFAKKALGKSRSLAHGPPPSSCPHKEYQEELPVAPVESPRELLPEAPLQAPPEDEDSSDEWVPEALGTASSSTAPPPLAPLELRSGVDSLASSDNEEMIDDALNMFLEELCRVKPWNLPPGSFQTFQMHLQSQLGVHGLAQARSLWHEKPSRFRKKSGELGRGKPNVQDRAKSTKRRIKKNVNASNKILIPRVAVDVELEEAATALAIAAQAAKRVMDSEGINLDELMDLEREEGMRLADLVLQASTKGMVVSGKLDGRTLLDELALLVKGSSKTCRAHSDKGPSPKTFFVPAKSPRPGSNKAGRSIPRSASAGLKISVYDRDFQPPLQARHVVNPPAGMTSGRGLRFGPTDVGRPTSQKLN